MLERPLPPTQQERDRYGEPSSQSPNSSSPVPPPPKLGGEFVALRSPFGYFANCSIKLRSVGCRRRDAVQWCATSNPHSVSSCQMGTTNLAWMCKLCKNSRYHCGSSVVVRSSISRQSIRLSLKSDRTLRRPKTPHINCSINDRTCCK
jgi:hypothetical protein